ncbi:MAG: ATP-binding protein [bacterium]
MNDLADHPDQRWSGLRLRWWGFLAGIVGGTFDTALMSRIGVALTIGGWDARLLVAAYFGISFAALGYLVGVLIEGQRRERRSAALLQAQSEATAAARARVGQHEKLAALGQLAATIAHEVRNPLGIMRSAAQTLSETLPSANAEARQASDFIIAEIDRLANVVNSLLSYARPLQLTPRAVQAAELFDHAARLAGGDPALRRVRIVRADSTVMPPLYADADLISQVLLGLLGNAAEAMPDGGTVTLDAVALSDAVQLRVADCGPGVPADLRARIFEPFVTTRARGTGLGLAIARQIVEAHGGRIDIGDADGGGARFVVTLPIASAALAA